MYLLERSAWAMQTYPKWRAETEADMARGLAIDLAKEQETGKKPPGIHDKVSESPCAEDSIYELNETYIELKAGALQDKRGILTYAVLPVLYCIWGFGSLSVYFNTVWFTHVHYAQKTPATTMDYIDPIIMPMITFLVCFAVYKFFWRFIRLENFVQRRLLIRFNRVTRQVHLHRPGYAGGITTLKWEDISAEPVAGQPEWKGAGTQLLLAWTNDVTGLPYFHLMFVGKIANSTSEITNLWEFIRRYMEDGPQAVPRPRKLLSRIPWPWQSLEAPWSFMRPMWRAGPKRRVVIWTALLSPVMLIHAVGHWLSLLLCWEPRWPRIIREAGRPGKPTPPLSTAADWPPPPAPLKPVRKRKTSKRSVGSTKIDAIEASEDAVRKIRGNADAIQKQNREDAE